MGVSSSGPYKGTASTNLAALDVGSHTARLLVSRWSKDTRVLKPLLRKRAYIRLAKDFEVTEVRRIKSDAIERTLLVLDGFVRSTRELEVGSTLAVATGVVREAINQDLFLDAIQNLTGIRVRVISGEEEALLTGLGVLHALQIKADPFIVFDLGGGTTEFLIGAKGESQALSLPLGVAIATQRYISSDPADETEIERVRDEVTATLAEAFTDVTRSRRKALLVGTGGTVTTLAALIHRIPADHISPERMNGLVLTKGELEDLLSKMKRMTTREKVELLALDEGRADVILAGCLIVVSLMRFFQSSRVMVSLSDLLEGILIDSVKTEGTKILSEGNAVGKEGGYDGKQGF